MSGSEVEQSGTTSNEVEQDGPSPSEQWGQAEPGSRVSKGVYSIWKGLDGALVLSFRVDGAEEDTVMPIPAGIVRMAFSAMDGKGPLGHMKGIVDRRVSKYLED